jgi:hypothetical protein
MFKIDSSLRVFLWTNFVRVAVYFGAKRQGSGNTGIQLLLKMVAVAPRLLRSRNSFRTFGNRYPPALACAAF